MSNDRIRYRVLITPAKWFMEKFPDEPKSIIVECDWISCTDNTCGVAVDDIPKLWIDDEAIDDINCYEYEDYITTYFDKAMQCTGLRDKHGKLIYENDVVRVSNGSVNGMPIIETYPVEWRICYWDMLEVVDDEGNHVGDKTHWVEIIGNVHENKELLT